jgi:hypothetical protein
MKIYTELELLGFFRWLLETHELSYTEGISPKYLDGLPLTDIHRTVCNAMAFRWFRDKHSIYFTPKQFDETKWIVEWRFCEFIGVFDIFEEAEVACLGKLIEIIKNEENEQTNGS